MSDLIFNFGEVEEHGKHSVDAHGKMYIGRKYSGKELTWIKLKDEVDK